MPFVASCNYLDGFELIKKAILGGSFYLLKNVCGQPNLFLVHARKKKGRDSNESRT
jgi:hypothetical protein